MGNTTVTPQNFAPVYIFTNTSGGNGATTAFVEALCGLLGISPFPIGDIPSASPIQVYLTPGNPPTDPQKALEGALEQARNKLYSREKTPVLYLYFTTTSIKNPLVLLDLPFSRASTLYAEEFGPLLHTRDIHIVWATRGRIPGYCEYTPLLEFLVRHKSLQNLHSFYVVTNNLVDEQEIVPVLKQQITKFFSEAVYLSNPQKDYTSSSWVLDFANQPIQFGGRYWQPLLRNVIVRYTIWLQTAPRVLVHEFGKAHKFFQNFEAKSPVHWDRFRLDTVLEYSLLVQGNPDNSAHVRALLYAVKFSMGYHLFKREVHKHLTQAYLDNQFRSPQEPFEPYLKEVKNRLKDYNDLLQKTVVDLVKGDEWVFDNDEETILGLLPPFPSFVGRTIEQVIRGLPSASEETHALEPQSPSPEREHTNKRKSDQECTPNKKPSLGSTEGGSPETPIVIGADEVATCSRQPPGNSPEKPIVVS